MKKTSYKELEVAPNLYQLNLYLMEVPNIMIHYAVILAHDVPTKILVDNPGRMNMNFLYLMIWCKTNPVYRQSTTPANLVGSDHAIYVLK